MQIIEMVKLDAAGRISLRKLFDEAEMPERVLVTFDTETGRLAFIDEKDIPKGWRVPVRRIGSVDSKLRLTVPAWVRREFGTEFLVTADSRSEHYLLARRYLHNLESS